MASFASWQRFNRRRAHGSPRESERGGERTPTALTVCGCLVADILSSALEVPNMLKLRVLVVDDHDVVRRGVCVLLSQEPALDVIYQTGSGEDAVRKAAELHPDLVVLDIGLPGISGSEAACQILQTSPTSKIIFLSQHDSMEKAREAWRVGGRGYVSKVDAPSELLTAIRSLDEEHFFVSQQLRRQGWTAESPMGCNLKHPHLRWDSATREWSCVECGQTSDHTTVGDAHEELNQRDCEVVLDLPRP